MFPLDGIDGLGGSVSFCLLYAIMAVGKNKGLSKGGKKGVKKKM